jgi:hypothetical protein
MRSVARTDVVTVDGVEVTVEAGPENDLESASVAVLWSGVRKTGVGVDALRRSLFLLEDVINACPPGHNIT